MSLGHTERISVTVPSDLRYGEATRSLLDTLSKRLEQETSTEGLNAHVISAFNEAFNNVVEHAYAGCRTKNIDIEVVVGAGEIVISLTDSGQSFNIDNVVDPDLDAMPEGGLGLMIIRSFMTDVDYRNEDERNVLTMTKVFNQPLSFDVEAKQEV